eukprot:c8926_g1_i1.p1 GENE.c8926_g1_i1~~c8926_g1_i1.p1  ORF type:complete len:356 (+),score=68.19 c8926_g1_i1:29-1096(+)
MRGLVLLFAASAYATSSCERYSIHLEGWNGNTLTISSCTDEVITSVSLEGAVGDLCLPDLDPFNSFIVTVSDSSSKSGEVTWEIFDGESIVLNGGEAQTVSYLCLSSTPQPTWEPTPEPTPLIGCESGYTLRMVDTYGDGWNGNELIVATCDGSVQFTATLSNGRLGYTCFPDIGALSEGGYTIYVGHGRWPEEVQWDVLYGEEIVLSGSAPHGYDFGCGVTFTPEPTPTSEPPQPCQNVDVEVTCNVLAALGECDSIAPLVYPMETKVMPVPYQYIHNLCPFSCGCCSFGDSCACNNNKKIHEVAWQYGVGWIRSCQQALNYVSCDNRMFGSLLKENCPCECGVAPVPTPIPEV